MMSIPWKYRTCLRVLDGPRWRHLTVVACLAVIVLMPYGVGAEQGLGSVTFAVDGVEKHFEDIPSAGARYNQLFSGLRAHSPAGENIQINITKVDLKKLHYPIDLPLTSDPNRAGGEPAAKAAVGFAYTNAEGEGWHGLGKIRIESFGHDGVIEGSFDDVTLACLTDKKRSDITLTRGTFRARITKPW